MKMVCVHCSSVQVYVYTLVNLFERKVDSIQVLDVSKLLLYKFKEMDGVNKRFYTRYTLMCACVYVWIYL